MRYKKRKKYNKKMITTTITPTIILYTHLLCIRQTDPNSIFFLFFALRRSLEECYVNVFSIFYTRSQSFIAIRVGFEIPLEYPREFSNDTHTHIIIVTSYDKSKDNDI
jgi:hypothetical protein